MLPPNYSRKSAGPATNSPSVSDEPLLAIHNRVNMARLHAKEQRAVFGAPLERAPTIPEPAPDATHQDNATASASTSMTMQQLMSMFENELAGIQRVASRADTDDTTRATQWFRLCAYAFELLRAVGIDNAAALKVISIRHLIGDRSSMPEVARHVLREKLQAVIQELEQGQEKPMAAEEQVGADSDQASLDTLMSAEVGPYHPDVDAEMLE